MSTARGDRVRAGPVKADHVAQPPRVGTVLAHTTRTGTTRSSGLGGHPRAAEVEAHESVHRAQFALAGRAPWGTAAELEAEARIGARAALASMAFRPRLAAWPDLDLAFDHASAGEHLPRFVAWLAKTHADYDADAIDWTTVLPALLASTRIYHYEDTEPAVRLSDRWRYRLLVEIFDQERAAGLPVPQPPVGGRSVPSARELEDLIFDGYLPTLQTGDFADADVQSAANAFLPFYLDQLEGVQIVPSTFRIEDFRPAPDPQLDTERTRVLDDWTRTELKDLTFRFLLDDFARAIGGPHATVSTLPPLMGSGVHRSLSPEQWLATLDLVAYKDRLVAATASVAVARLGKDAAHQRLLRSAADAQSRFETLQALCGVLWSIDRNRVDTVQNLRTLTMGELDPDALAVMGDPYLALHGLTAVQTAATAFFDRLRTDADNDAVMAVAAELLAKAVGAASGVGSFLLELVRLLTAVRSYQNKLKESRQAVEQRLRAELLVRYDDIAAGIQQMGAFATTFLDKTFIPRLHKIALDRITANVQVLRERRDNWTVYSAATAKKMMELAALLDDFSKGLRSGSYDRIEFRGQIVTVKDVKQLEDAAKICRAEAIAMRMPTSMSKRYAKLTEALNGFADVKDRIEHGKVEPNRYGIDVFNAARKELHLDAFAEYTTYGDVVFGRQTAGENPFLARLVIGWKVVEDLDDGLRGIVVMAALGLLTVASLLTGTLAAAFLPPLATQAVGIVLFAVDAAVNIGMAWHEKNEAKAFLELVRLDLDQSVTGVSEKDAERALTMAWIGLVLAVGLVVGGIALGAAARYAKGSSKGFALSARFFALAREEPALFASLRKIVPDAARLDRMLAFAADANHLEALLHRMDRVLDLQMVERFLEGTGDAAHALRALDVAGNARSLDTALTGLVARVPTGSARAALLELAGHDAVNLLAVLERTSDVAAARRLFGLVPEASRLAAILRLPAAASLSEDAIRTLGKLEPDALRLLQNASARDIADVVRLVEQEPAMVNALFRDHGEQVLRHVQRAPYDTAAGLQTALRRSASRLGPQPGYQVIPVPALQKRTELVPGWTGVLAKNKTTFTTKVESASGKPLTLRTRWDGGSGELALDSAFTNPGIEEVPQAPVLVRKGDRQGAPAPVYFTLQQMRAAKIPYGAPAGAGGVRTVRLHQIQNMDSVAHLEWLRRRYPNAALKDLVPDTAIYKYGETIANQSGYRVVGVEVDTSGMVKSTPAELTEHYARPVSAREQRGMTPDAVRLEHQQILDRFGIDANAPVNIDFDIVLKVEPWTPG